MRAKIQSTTQPEPVTCRSLYGPLKIGIESKIVANSFTIYVEDPRTHRTVRETSITGTKTEAQNKAISIADEYLKSRAEKSGFKAKWKCK